MNLTKGQVIFLIIVALIATFFLTGVMTFALNDAMKMLPRHWNYLFTVEALINNYPNAYKALGLSALISFGIAAIVPFIPQKESLFGKARFANPREVKKMNLYGDKGIIIGKFQGKLLRFGGQQFVSLGAPTRSGKGVGIIIPNLLDWQDSAVVQDIKQECFDYTSRYRAEKLGQEVYLFNPFDRRTHRYNPLHYINMDGTNADGELTDLANILYPISSSNENSAFFNQLAQSLFIGLCYMCHDLLSTKKGLAFLKGNNLQCNFDLASILDLSSGFKFTIQSSEGNLEVSTFEETYKFLDEAGVLSKKATARIKDYFSIDSDNTRSGVMSSFNAPLMMFRADNMRLATSGNDFDFRDLRKKKMTIYVGITPDQLANAKQILNLFWQQLILVNTKELPDQNPEIKHKVLLVMDEFTAPGYLPIYLKGISFIAGYWLRSLIAYQAKSQLATPQPDGYGKDGAETLLTNHACQIFYTPRTVADSKEISEELGTKTVKNRSRNLGQGGGGSESETSRALMLPQELRELPFEEEIVRIDNGKPIKCNKAFYYNDKYFVKKLKETSPTLASIKKIPTYDELKDAVQKGELRTEVSYQTFDALELEIEASINKRVESLPDDDEEDDYYDEKNSLTDEEIEEFLREQEEENSNNEN